MRTYKVNKIEYTVFDSVDELPDNIHYLKDWRDGQEYDWVQADDNCVIQILKRGILSRPRDKVKQVPYVRTCTGTFIVNKSTKMDTSKRINIYSLGGNLTSEEALELRKKLNSKEELFVLNLARNMAPSEAYMKAFPTNNPGYASVKAGQLIKTERIKTVMNERLKPVCEELDITDLSVLEGIKTISETAKKDDTKLKALFKLSDILDLEDKTKTTVQQISGAVFQGFSKDQLDNVERKEITEG